MYKVPTPIYANIVRTYTVDFEQYKNVWQNHIQASLHLFFAAETCKRYLLGTLSQGRISKLDRCSEDEICFGRES